MSFKLQFNLKGSWRDVLSVDCDEPSIDFDLVVEAAQRLLEAAGKESGSFRMVDEGGEVALICDKWGKKAWPHRTVAI